jgi:transmembrane sensor
MEDRNNRLVIAYFDKSIDDDGLAELKEWLESNPENQEVFSETIQILSASKSFFVKPVMQEDSWSRIAAHVAASQNQTDAEESRTSTINTAAAITAPTFAQPASIPKMLNMKSWLLAAVAFFGISSAALVVFQQIKQPGVILPTYTSFSNPNGSSSRITLPDGSLIHLGAGSKISYEKSFTSKKRLVSLDGEAFFDVKHNASRPFIVKSGTVSTVVLGTSFNIKAFSSDGRVLITVNTGKVGVVAALKGRSRVVNYLLPDEQLEINTAEGKTLKRHTSAQAVSGWTDNNFVYYNTSLKDITASLARHYGVKINYSDAALGSIKLTAKFNNMPLADVTDNLEQLSGLTFKMNNKEITVLKHQQKRRATMK